MKIRKPSKFLITKLESRIEDLSSQEKKQFDSHLKYDKKLLITLYGEPIADSRPRGSKVSNTFYSKNIGILRKFYNPLYDKDELLTRTIIDSPFHLGFKFYMTPSKKLMSSFGFSKKTKPNKVLYKLFIEEKLPDMSIKDCDNMVKIYNDLFCTTERNRITMDDGFNIGFTRVDKYISLNPRTEITIYYSSKPSFYFTTQMKDHHSYFKFNISRKHMFIHNRTPQQQLKYLDSYFKVKFKEIKGNAIIPLVKTILIFFEDNYTSELISELVSSIGDMKNYTKMNKVNNIYILMSYLFRNNKIVYDMMNNSMKKYESILNGEEWTQ